METSTELDGDNMSYYQEIIGFIWWAIEFGWANIATEVALLSIHLALPHHGHIYQWLNINAYLNKPPYSKLVMKPSYINVKVKFGKRFNNESKWFEFYGDFKE